MSETLRLPQRVQDVIERVLGGQRLCKETGGAEIVFFLEPSGSRIESKSAQEAINSGLLRPMCDGLLGPDTSQTWTAI